MKRRDEGEGKREERKILFSLMASTSRMLTALTLAAFPVRLSRLSSTVQMSQRAALSRIYGRRAETCAV
jgi:hypothetical protein